MKAAVTTQIGDPSVIQLQEVPDPVAKPGWVHIEIKAAGLNRSEMYTRQGHSPNVRFPRIQGIEGVGVVKECPSGKFRPGQQVAAIMGEMGREFDGGYAEQTVVPERIVFPFESDLPWATLGAIPEMFQTANGSLVEGLELQPGETLLVRGGTSSVGIMAAQIAKTMDCTVFSTTRSESKKQTLLDIGVDEVILDAPDLSKSVREVKPEGVDKVLELIGTKTLGDSLKCVRPQGIVCMTGILGNEWVWKDFAPFEHIPNYARLTSYGGDAHNLSSEMLQTFLDNVAAGKINIQIDRTFSLSEMAEAHELMESGKAKGKLVLVI